MFPILLATAYIFGFVLVIGYIVIALATLALWTSQKSSTTKPNEFYTDHQVYYPCGYTKRFKVLAMITIAGFVIGFFTIPAAVIGSIVWDNPWGLVIVALIISLVIIILVGRLPFRHGEECLIIDSQQVRVKYEDDSKDDKVFYISQYQRFIPPTRNVAVRLIFDEELYLGFLRRNDAITVTKMIDFIKRNGRFPIVQNAVPAPGNEKFVERRKSVAAPASVTPPQDNAPHDKAYLEGILNRTPLEKRIHYIEMIASGQKNEAIREFRFDCGEGLRAVVDVAEKYLTFPDLNSYKANIYVYGSTSEKVRASLAEYYEDAFRGVVYEVADGKWVCIEAKCSFTDYLNLVLWLEDAFAYAEPIVPGLKPIYAAPDKTDSLGEKCVGMMNGSNFVFNVPEYLLSYGEELKPDFDIKSFVADKLK